MYGFVIPCPFQACLGGVRHGMMKGQDGLFNDWSVLRLPCSGGSPDTAFCFGKRLSLFSPAGWHSSRTGGSGGRVYSRFRRRTGCDCGCRSSSGIPPCVLFQWFDYTCFRVQCQCFYLQIHVEIFVYIDEIHDFLYNADEVMSNDRKAAD